jgi:carbon storage regulator CsrA
VNRRSRLGLQRVVAQRQLHLALEEVQDGKKVVIGNGIIVTVVAVIGNQVRVGIDAPDQLRILRGELACGQKEPAACDESADPACPCGEDDVRPPR